MSLSAERAGIPLWFERRFDFSFPASLWPNLIVRLRGTPARLEEILRDYSHEALIRKPEGKWSAQENAGHLLQLESLWLARILDYAKESPRLTPADLGNKATDEANFGERAVSEILDGFRCARGELVQAVSVLDAALATRTLPHPRMGTPMRLVDHLYFVAEHDDHHLARIWELLHPPGMQ